MTDNRFTGDPHDENVRRDNKDPQQNPEAGWQEPTAYDNTGSQTYQQQAPADDYMAYRQQNYQQGNTDYQTYQQPRQDNYQTYMQNGDVRLQPIGVGEWVGTMLLMIIPIVNIIMLFVWAFGSGAKLSKRNWARANLIMALIAIGLSILLAGILVPLFATVFREMSYSFY